MSNCVSCGTVMGEGLAQWHFLCRQCGYEEGRLAPDINSPVLHLELNEDQRDSGLRSLRTENAKIIIRELKQMHSAASTLLDVGCAHGWFIEVAAMSYVVIGVEPDATVVQSASARGLNVRPGYFPNALDANEKFDVIVFNDVMEHIPQIATALDSCCEHLKSGGILVLNVPNSRGVFYRMSKMLYRLGVEIPFRRMWQVGLPSPHVHYFDIENLSQLCRARGFKLISSRHLKAISLRGLWQRVAHVKSGRLMAIATYFCAIVFLPFLFLFESDSIVCFYTKKVVASELKNGDANKLSSD